MSSYSHSLNANEPPPSPENKPNTFLRPHILEVPPGADILLSISDYARRRRRGVSVLSASGDVAGITLREAEPLQGRFEILSLTGTVMPPPAPPESGGLAVFISGGDGRVVGGRVAGPIVAAGPVVLTVAAFASTVCERLPQPGDGGDDGQFCQEGNANQAAFH